MGFFSNRYLIGAVVLSLTLQILVTVVPLFQVALGTIALSLEDWAMIFLVSSTVLFGDELRKLVSRRRIRG
jgi:Ca2+-transporting ATPase